MSSTTSDLGSSIERRMQQQAIVYQRVQPNGVCLLFGVIIIYNLNMTEKQILSLTNIPLFIKSSKHQTIPPFQDVMCVSADSALSSSSHSDSSGSGERGAQQQQQCAMTNSNSNRCNMGITVKMRSRSATGLRRYDNQRPHSIAEFGGFWVMIFIYLLFCDI
jgi:hypothetical protein